MNRTTSDVASTEPPDRPSSSNPGDPANLLHPTAATAPVVEEELALSVFELCRACRVREEQIRAWVAEGVLEPIGQQQPQGWREWRHEWRFAGASLRRAKLAVRLSRDLEIDTPGVALALDLMDEIAELKARLQRAGAA